MRRGRSRDRGGTGASPRVVVATDVRLYRPTPDGPLHATHTAGSHEAWRAYAAAFGEVVVLARVTTRPTVLGPLAQGPGVSVHAVPDYSGLRQFVLTGPRIVWAVRRLGRRQDVLVGRAGEPLSLLLYARSRVIGARFLSVVGADPGELVRAVRPGLAGRVAGTLLASATRHVVRRSDAVVYVTRQWLQDRYPARPGAPTLNRSDVRLVPAAYADAPRGPDRGTLRLVSIGTLQSRNKGQDCLVRVTRELASRGFDVHLDLVGEGRLSSAVRDLAVELGVGDRVHLHGQLNDVADVRRVLDAADVYVAASRSEGLPRATMEAMARSLPVVSTAAGGVGELIEARWLVPADDVAGLADAVAELARRPDLRVAVGAANLRRAREIGDLSDPERLVDFLRPWAEA